MMERVFNFSAGPAMIAQSVLEKARTQRAFAYTSSSRCLLRLCFFSSSGKMKLTSM